MNVLRALASTWLLVFWADTALGVVDEAGALVSGVHLLGWVRSITSAMILLTTPLLWLGVGASPRLPLGVFVPPLLFVLWVLVGAAPLSIWLLGTSGFGPALVALQVAVSAWAAWRVHRLEQTGRRLLLPEGAPGPVVQWPRFATWLGVHSVIVPPLLLVYTFTSVDLALRHATAGFVSLGLDGVRVTHRAYVRDDRTVDLVGMIHIGDGRAYEALFEPIPVGGTLVLEEGVRDEQGLLPGGPVYDRVARGLGIETQRPVGQMSALETRNADVDVSQFSDDTLKFLRKVLAIYAAEDTAAAVLDYVIYVRGQPDQEALLANVAADLLERRNQNLLEHIDSALDHHERVVVPWGAYHLPELEEAILARGFAAADERTVTLIPFSALGR